MVEVRLRRVFAVAVAACLGLTCTWRARVAFARDDPSASSADPLDGTGRTLLSTREAGVLPLGRFEVGFLLDNYDRDPLGIDVVDGSVSLRLGVGRGVELGLTHQVTRSVSSPGAHPVPPPPLDVVALDGRLPREPYRAMYWPMPYLSHHGARVDDMIQGEYTLGIRRSLFPQRGLRPALTVGAQVTVPGTTARYPLSKGSGSGTLDAGFKSAASWRYGSLRLSANLGLTVNNDVDIGDRLVGGEAISSLCERTIRRPEFLQAGMGLRLPVRKDLSAVAEVSGWSPVGGHTPMQSESGASDLLVGLLLDVKKTTVALGLRWHLGAPADGQSLPVGPLAGAVNLSSVPAAERARFLDSFGGAAPRPDANVVVTGLPLDAELPDGAVYLPSVYETHTQGNIGMVFRISMRLGQ
jgi:hypothetical protein